MTNLKIFLVDDDIYYLHLLEQHLKNMGVMHIRLFNTGEDSLGVFGEYRPDIVFLDYQMDLAVDFDILKKIKLFDPNIYVVMLVQKHTRLSDDVHRYGAFDVIQKGNKEPQKVKELLERIVDILKMLDRPVGLPLKENRKEKK